MKKPYKVLLFFLLLLILTFVVFKYVEEITVLKHAIYSHISTIASKVTTPESESPTEQEQSAEFEKAYNNFSPFVHPEDAWYKNAEYIYHAGGGIDGLDYTNSKEAIHSTIEHGSVIEIDFRYTKDNVLVCAHNWSDVSGFDELPPTLSEFESTKVCGKYTPMTAKNLIDFMYQHENVYIVIDTKEPDSLHVVKNLIQICEADPNIADRFIIQLYSKNTKQSFLDLYPFPNENLLFTCYKYGTDCKDILTICMNENIPVVTVPHNSWSVEEVELFTEKGIIIYEHTVNRPDYAMNSKSKGIHGFYTDFLIAP